jgi:hypothetical protein
LGWREAQVEKLDDSAPRQIFEISDAGAWTDLCREYPLDVTASRRHDWYRVTGRDGRWVIPDWSRVALDFDGVHLPIDTYLASAGLTISVGQDVGSMIAGWDPDETYWLRDMPCDPTTASYWTRTDDSDQWERRYES